MGHDSTARDTILGTHFRTKFNYWFWLYLVDLFAVKVGLLTGSLGWVDNL